MFVLPALLVSGRREEFSSDGKMPPVAEAAPLPPGPPPGAEPTPVPGPPAADPTDVAIPGAAAPMLPAATAAADGW